MARMYVPENKAVVTRLNQSLKAAARAGDLVRQILQFEHQGSDLFISGEPAQPKSSPSNGRLEPARVDPDAVPHGNGEAVLYVDDEVALCRLVEVTLRRCGYNGITTTDPEEAVALFRAQPQRFGAVISDYTMPKMTGLSVAEEIKKIAPRMPVILTTGVTSEFDPDLTKSPHVDALVSKPFTMQALAVELAKWIAASRPNP
jgi:CheY-like chemotaxis protein